MQLIIRQSVDRSRCAHTAFNIHCFRVRSSISNARLEERRSPRASLFEHGKNSAVTPRRFNNARPAFISARRFRFSEVSAADAVTEIIRRWRFPISRCLENFGTTDEAGFRASSYFIDSFVARQRGSSGNK